MVAKPSNEDPARSNLITEKARIPGYLCGKAFGHATCRNRLLGDGLLRVTWLLQPLTLGGRRQNNESDIDVIRASLVMRNLG